MTREEEIDIRESEVQRLVKEILGVPWAWTSTAAGSKIHIEIELPAPYKAFKKTCYYYNGSSFIHFTNIETAFSILESGSIWLFNLLKKNDKKEFTYISDLLGSFCKTTDSYFFNLDFELRSIKNNQKGKRLEAA